jgi:hypothetical protein
VRGRRARVSSGARRGRECMGSGRARVGVVCGCRWACAVVETDTCKDGRMLCDIYVELHHDFLVA